MNILIFPVLLVFSAAWAAGAADPADTAKPVQSCDMSVIEPAFARKNWKTKDGKEWTAIKMENGFALCLFSSRYLLFNENIDSILSVEEESGGIVVAFRGKPARTYFVNSQDLLSKSLPYRGCPAEKIYWASVTYDKNVSTKAAIVILHIGSSIDKQLDAVLSRFASQSPFWSNPNIRKEIKRWALEEKGKETWGSLNDFEPQVRLLLDIPGALATEVVRENVPGEEKQSTIVSVPDVEVARFICGDDLHAGEKSPHKILTTADLLPLLDEER